MVVKRIAIFLVSIGFIFHGYAVGINDTTSFITGTIVDAVTDKPIPDAKIFYQDLPYGNYVGIFICEDGSINVEVDNSFDYQVRASAEGYNPQSARLEVTKSGGALNHIFKLMPSEGGHLIRINSLQFAQGDYKINEEAFEELDNVVYQMLVDNPNMVIQLEGHTDRNMSRNVNTNFKLSEKRVEEVKQYLVNKGIDSRRIKTKAFGGTKPIENNREADVAGLNRRVEVRILSNYEQ